MLNEYNIDYDIVVIKADGASKYGVNVLINKSKLKLIDSITDGYWNITLKDGNYYAYTKVNGKKIYMHELLGINNSNTLINIDDNSNQEYDYYYPSFITSLDKNTIETSKLIDILNSDDKDNIKNALNYFKSFLLDCKKDRIGKKVIDIDAYLHALDLYDNNNLTCRDLKGLNYSIENICEDWTMLELEHKSQYILENDIIFVYPIIKELVAAKNYICEFGGIPIYKGETYYRCKLFIEDYTNHSVYSSKDLTISEDYIDYFPTTVSELNDFLYKIDSSYDCNNEEYYNIAVNIKNSHFGLKLIKKKK